jgi:hypothetical protein
MMYHSQVEGMGIYMQCMALNTMSINIPQKVGAMISTAVKSVCTQPYRAAVSLPSVESSKRINMEIWKGMG